MTIEAMSTPPALAEEINAQELFIGHGIPVASVAAIP
jgi:hypothetical protein